MTQQIEMFETTQSPAIVRPAKPRSEVRTMSVPFVRDSETSKAAAETVLNSVTQENRVYAILQECGPLTDEEIHRQYVLRYSEVDQPCKDSSIRARRVNLYNHGMVFDSYETRAASSGRQMTIWTTVEPQNNARSGR